jgi:formylglycine-generating enzyme required for sulfatase activity
MKWVQLATLVRCAVLAVVVLPLVAAGPVDTERRIALVIGISAYQNAPALANPVNDARAIGESLRRLKFDVTELYDTNYRDLSNGIREFGIRAANSDVAVVYYAGHGVQVDRENYLIPADARLARERDLLYEAMPLDRLLGEVSQAAHIGMVLLDSCRNNPFIERVARSMTVAGRAVATTPGLARVDNVPRNTMVVMAAKADQIAEDGVDHSPFAAALLAHFQIPGLELSLFFRSVRDTVLRATGNRQEPYVFSSLGAEPFYFYPRPPNRPPVVGAVQALELNDVAGPTALGMSQPTDPDQDPLTIRVIGLPRFGEVRIDGRAAAANTVVSAEALKTATYKPDGKSTGRAGTFDILVEDGRGGSVTASLPIVVVSSHRPPVVGGPGRVRIEQQALGIPPPVSPDGDTLTITVEALPRGVVRNGNVPLRVGDHLTPQELAGLTFWPEAGFTGPAGSLRYSVDNGHGGVTRGATDIDVGTPDKQVATAEDEAVWGSLRGGADMTRIDAFIRLFPNSRFAAEARGRRDELAAAARPPPAAKPAEPQQMAAMPPDPAVPPLQPTASRLITAANGPIVALPPTKPPAEAGGGRQFQDCPDCPVMIRIPAGHFMMGAGARTPDVLPTHHVEIRAFALGRAPVTVAEWKACLAAKGCTYMPRMHVAEDVTPVHNLSWDDVSQYLTWLSGKAGHPYRLPTEAEWEYAARAGTASRYWWGEAVGVALANCGDCGGPQMTKGPMPVDAARPNPFGLLGMLGGVAQWTADCWFPNYSGAPSDGSARESKGCEKRVLRGGSFRNVHDDITVTARGNYDAPVRYIANGFRVARGAD